MEHIGRAGEETKWANQPVITVMCGTVHIYWQLCVLKQLNLREELS